MKEVALWDMKGISYIQLCVAKIQKTVWFYLYTMPFKNVNKYIYINISIDLAMALKNISPNLLNMFLLLQ